MDILIKEQMEFVAKRTLMHLKNDMIKTWCKNCTAKSAERVSIEDFIDRKQFLLLFSVASGAKIDTNDYAGWYEVFEMRVAEEARRKLVSSSN